MSKKKEAENFDLHVNLETIDWLLAIDFDLRRIPLDAKMGSLFFLNLKD